MDDQYVSRADLLRLIQQGIASAQQGQEPGTAPNVFYAAVGYEAALRSLARHLDIPLPEP